MGSQPTNGSRFKLASYQSEWTRLPRYWTTPSGERKAKPKTFLKARRIGGSCAAAIDAANMAAGFEWDGQRFVDALPIDVHIISATNAQAKNVLVEVAEFLERVSEREPRYRADPKATSIEFATGARIVALSCKPSSLRTYTGAVLFDEIAFYQRPEEVWGAAKNIASSTLKEPRGYPVSLVTTPWAYGGFVHGLFTNEKLGFSRLAVDIYAAKKAGFPIDIEQTRAESGLAEIFATEYECQWMKGGACFFDPDLLAGAERDEDLPESLAREPSFWGIDIGRTNDLTVLVECKRLGDVVWIVRIIALRGMHFDDQRDAVVSTLTEGKLGRLLIDRGGMGRDLADHLERKFSSRAKGVDFSQDTKEQMAVAFRGALESGRVRFWTGGTIEQVEQVRALRMELVAIKTKAANGGKLSFETPRNATGHGDRAWAAMLALQAVGATTQATEDDNVEAVLVHTNLETSPLW